MAQDPVTVDPKHYTVEFENDHVRVVRIRYGPREKSVMHEHPPGLVVFLTDADFKFTYPDGRTENIRGKTGQFLWFAERWEHLPENLSETGFEAVYVDLKT
jgi:quercetin dioxygenase-like cupin family protein